jgi:hypothetical protein
MKVSSHKNGSYVTASGKGSVKATAKKPAAKAAAKPAAKKPVAKPAQVGTAASILRAARAKIDRKYVDRVVEAMGRK